MDRWLQARACRELPSALHSKAQPRALAEWPGSGARAQGDRPRRAEAGHVDACVSLPFSLFLYLRFKFSQTSFV